MQAFVFTTVFLGPLNDRPCRCRHDTPLETQIVQSAAVGMSTGCTWWFCITRPDCV